MPFIQIIYNNHRSLNFFLYSCLVAKLMELIIKYTLQYNFMLAQPHEFQSSPVQGYSAELAFSKLAVSFVPSFYVMIYDL